jgi:hypothetical protein
VAHDDELPAGVGNLDGVLVNHDAHSGGLADAARETEVSVRKTRSTVVSQTVAQPGQALSEERMTAGKAYASLGMEWASFRPPEEMILQPEKQRACAKEEELLQAVSLDPSLADVPATRATGWPAFELIGRYSPAVLLACGYDPDEVSQAPDEARKAGERWAKWTNDNNLDSFLDDVSLARALAAQLVPGDASGVVLSGGG